MSPGYAWPNGFDKLIRQRRFLNLNRLIDTTLRYSKFTKRSGYLDDEEIGLVLSSHHK